MPDTTTPAPTFTHATWADWIADPANAQLDDDVKLNTLRDYVWETARDAHTDDPSTVRADWVNKKLGKLGVTARLDAVNSYTLEVPVSGKYVATVTAASRTEAEAIFARQLDQDRLVVQKNSTFWTLADSVFTAGPEDPTPGVVDPEAPTTVDATLVKLRETILLGVIAGPKFCVHGANEALASFGLGSVPERKKFTVTRPVDGFAETTVEAFDALSAERVASWRWEDGHRGFKVSTDDVAVAGDFVVTEKS